MINEHGGGNLADDNGGGGAGHPPMRGDSHDHSVNDGHPPRMPPRKLYHGALPASNRLPLFSCRAKRMPRKARPMRWTIRVASSRPVSLLNTEFNDPWSAIAAPAEAAISRAE